MPALYDVAREKLNALTKRFRKRGLTASLRKDNAIVTRNGKNLISFSCNDYLGLSQHEKVKESAINAIRQYGCGAGASRLVTGNHPLYIELEEKLAKWKGTQSALVFGSGYLANSGIIPAIVGKDDLIIADKLVHACLIDGARLSGSKLLRFAHNDINDCERLLAANRTEYRNCLIITDEVFSMDGDTAPLAGLGAISRQHDAWLMADGAHSLIKPDAPVDIYVGTLSKALGSYGGYVCARKEIIEYIVTTARSFMFSTALPPAVIAASMAALDIIMENPDITQKPIDNAKAFTKYLGLPEATSPIVPLVIGDEEKAVAAASELAEAGFLVVAIRPPTVPEGTSRLRFAFSSLHKKQDIMEMAEFIMTKDWFKAQITTKNYLTKQQQFVRSPAS